MGAEFISATTSLPHTIDGKLLDLDLENLRSKIDSLVSTETIERVNSFCEESSRFEDPDNVIFENTKYSDEDFDATSELVLDRDDVVTMLVEAYRRTQEPDVIVDPYLHTATVGCTSWGDAPEGYDEICLLAESGIFDRPIYSPATIEIPHDLSAVVRQYANSLPPWDNARPGLELLAETISGAIGTDLAQEDIERVFNALILREKL